MLLNTEHSTLAFLQKDDEAFRSSMIDYIKTRFADSLTEQDLLLLDKGDDQALAVLAERTRGYLARSSTRSQ